MSDIEVAGFGICSLAEDCLRANTGEPITGEAWIGSLLER